MPSYEEEWHACLKFRRGKGSHFHPYWHAEELLADGRGLLVPFGDSPSISRAVCDLLRNETTHHAIRKNAYLMGEHSAQTAKCIEPPTLDQQRHRKPVPVGGRVELQQERSVFLP